MADTTRDRPCIDVCLVGGAAEELYRWVEIGAEEEGVPTRNVTVEETEAVAAAYAAAQSSRFDIGLSITPSRVVLHEKHMPPGRPVLSFETGSEDRQVCRLMGSNAARMVIRLPLRFAVEVKPPAGNPKRAPAARSRSGQAPAARLTDPEPAGPDDIEVRQIARILVRILRERGVV